jgi:hypothetical protein
MDFSAIIEDSRCSEYAQGLTIVGQLKRASLVRRWEVVTLFITAVSAQDHTNFLVIIGKPLDI